jgi:hypothetical protein
MKFDYFLLNNCNKIILNNWSYVNINVNINVTYLL